MILLIAYSVRDQMWLRVISVISLMLYQIYYLTLPNILWSPFIWGVLFIVVNLYVVFELLKDRSELGMSDFEKGLYRQLHEFTPGEIRLLCKRGAAFSIAEQETIILDQQPVKKLYYVMTGQAEVVRDSTALVVGPETFLGEFSFIMQQNATGTVTLLPGAKGVCWDRATLRKLFDKKPRLKTVFDSIIAKDLVRKLAD